MNRASESLHRWRQAVRQLRSARGEPTFLATKPRRALAGGTEVTGYGDYHTGDDFRYVDWARCARHDELVSRKYERVLPRTVYVLLDGSASMALDDGKKFALGKQLAAGIAELTLANGDSLRMRLFAGQTTEPLQYPLDDEAPRGGPTDLAAACRGVTGPDDEPGLIVLVSDLMDPAGLELGLTGLQHHRHQVLLVHVLDPADAQPDWLGRMQFADAAGAGHLAGDVDRDDLEDYQRRFCDWIEQLRRKCRDRDVGYLQASTDEPSERILQRMLAL